MKKITMLLLIIILSIFMGCNDLSPGFTPSEGEGEGEAEATGERVVLVELFNTEGCAASTVANPIAEQLAEEYGTGKVILVEEAGWGVYSTIETTERFSWYVPGEEKHTPFIAINGLNETLGSVGSIGDSPGYTPPPPPLPTPTTPINHAPVISSLVANPENIGLGDSSVITCNATDQDGDSLNYSWTKTGGTITGSGQTITWTAPATTGTYTITCTVDDGKGEQDSASVDVEVIGSNSVKIFLRDGGTLNGMSINTSNPVISVSAGETISGTVNIEVQRPTNSSGNVTPVGYTPSWGTHSSSYVGIINSTPIGTINYNVSINLTAPNTPGTYYLTFASHYETGVQWIMSQTNWTVGTTQWDDGNDIADQTEAEIGGALSNGYAFLNMWENGKYKLSAYGITYVKIEVGTITDYDFYNIYHEAELEGDYVVRDGYKIKVVTVYSDGRVTYEINDSVNVTLDPGQFYDGYDGGKLIIYHEFGDTDVNKVAAWQTWTVNLNQKTITPDDLQVTQGQQDAYYIIQTPGNTPYNVGPAKVTSDGEYIANNWDDSWSTNTVDSTHYKALIDIPANAPIKTYDFWLKYMHSGTGDWFAQKVQLTVGLGVPDTRIIRLEGDLHFDDVQVGSTSQKILTIYNDGNSTLTVTNIDYPTGFSGPWSGPISAGGSHSVTVTFSPTQAITYGGNLTVNSDKTGGTNTKWVEGNGGCTSPPVSEVSALALTYRSTKSKIQSKINKLIKEDEIHRSYPLVKSEKTTKGDELYEINIEWAEYTGADGYRIYRSINGGSYTLISEGNVDPGYGYYYFADTNAVAGSTYSYYVTAYATGWETCPSQFASTTPLPSCSLISPTNGATISNPTPAFSWSPVGVASYPYGTISSGVSDLWVYDDTAGSTSWQIFMNNLTTSSGTYNQDGQATALISGHSYIWDSWAYGYDGSGNLIAISESEDWMFDYGCTLPSPPTLSDPGSSLESPATYTVSWSSVSGATYVLQEDTSPDFSGAISYPLSGTSKDFSHTVSTTTTYYYRVAAVNSCGQGGWSNVEEIIVGVVPTVTTQAATNIETNSVTANGTITSDGGSKIIEKGFEYGLTQTPTWSVKETGTDLGTGTFSNSISDLNSDTTYWVKAYAVNNDGKSANEDWQEFHTPPDNIIITNEATFTCDGQQAVTSDCDITLSYKIIKYREKQK